MSVKLAISDDRLMAMVGLIRDKNKKEKIRVDQITTLLMQSQFNFGKSAFLIEKGVNIFNGSQSSVSKFRIYDDRFLELENYFTVIISADEMKASVDAALPPELAQIVTYQFITRLLKKNNVAGGVDNMNVNQLIKKLQAEGNVEGLVVAEGTQEVIAVDGECKLAQSFTGREKIERFILKGTKREKIIMQAKVTEKPVAKGAILMIKSLPVDGQEGMTIAGKKLWSASNRHRVKDPIVVVSKNVLAKKFSDRIEYSATAKGYGYFLNDKIIEVDEILDGDFKVRISDDKMNLFLTLQAPKGGEPVSLEKIREDIEKLKIKSPIDEELMVRSLGKVNNGEADKLENLLLATGTQPVNGQNGKIHWNSDLELFYKPQILDDGSVDYRGGRRFPFVREGKSAGTWIMATKGQRKGLDVQGNILEPDDGAEIDTAFGKSFELQEDEKNSRPVKHIMPLLSGLLKIKKKTAEVDPVLEVQVVDYSTGNIDFDGTLVIKETINDGFKVKCTGDIHIHGNIGACEIESDGDLFVKGGVNGGGAAKIRSGGSIYIKYAENCRMVARDSIFVVSHTVLSNLISLKDIIVGIKRVKGRVIGSDLYAWRRIETDIIGSKLSSADSHLFAGINKEVYDEMMEKKAALELTKIEITKIQNDIKSPKDIRKAYLDGLRLQLNEKIEELNTGLEEVKVLEEQIFNEEVEHVLVRGGAKAHTEILLAQQSQELFSDVKGVKFVLEEGKIDRQQIQKKRGR